MIWNSTSCKIVFPHQFQIGLKYHYAQGKNYSQGNLRMSRDQFWSLLILLQKSAKNYPSQKLEHICPQTCFIASQSGKKKVSAKFIFLK